MNGPSPRQQEAASSQRRSRDQPHLTLACAKASCVQKCRGGSCARRDQGSCAREAADHHLSPPPACPAVFEIILKIYTVYPAKSRYCRVLPVLFCFCIYESLIAIRRNGSKIPCSLHTVGCIPLNLTPSSGRRTRKKHPRCKFTFPVMLYHYIGRISLSIY